jgi:ubiquinone biosynthesis protein UbiJ
MQLPAGVQKGLESAINRYLRLDPDSNARMAALDGRCICIELVGLDLQLFIHPGEQGIRLSDHLDAAAEPDTVLRGTPLGMARLGLGQDTEKTLFSGEVTITGDVETGQTFKGILDAMDVDWEEQLSKLTGDVIAHQLANGARRIGTLLKHGRHTLQQDIGEYLQEELRVLPARIETENFSSDITRISMDTDRLAARIRRLQDRSETGPTP